MDAQELLRRKNEFDGNLVMGSRVFNTLTKRNIHIKSVTDRKKTLLDPDTCQLRSELVIPRECPLCNETNGELLFVKEGFPHIRCDSCEMVYVSPILKTDSLKMLYINEDTYTGVLENDLQIHMDTLKFDLFLDLIEEQYPKKGKLLDIGCGPGLFLSRARLRGWEVTGCEVNKACIEQLKSADIPVIDRPIEEYALDDESFQCIALLTVLEHIPEPKELLKKVRKNLVRGGILAILVPNINALANRILHEKSPTFSGDMHINHFSDSTLARMLHETGFDVTASETILTSIDSVNNHLNYESPESGSGKQVLSVLTPQYLHDNHLGYLLFTLARAR